MRKGIDKAAELDDEEQEGCTVEEIKDDEEPAAASAEPERPKVQSPETIESMINNIEYEPQPEYVSNLEELD